MYDLLGWIVFCFFFSASSLCPRPQHPLPSTSAPSTAGCLSLSRAGVRLGAPPHTVNFLKKKKKKAQLSLPQMLAWVMFFFFFFLAELHVGCSKAPRLKSAVWSMVITSRVLNPSGGWEVGGLHYVMGGRENRSETDSKSLSCKWHDILLPRLCVQPRAGSVPCPSACLENSCWSRLSPEESLISTHCMRSV